MQKMALTKLMCAALLMFTYFGTQSHAQNAGEGLLPIQQGGKWGYINRSGEVVIKPQFEAAEPFADGLALVRYPPRKKPLKPGEKKHGKFGYIDTEGAIVIPMQFEMAQPFSEGLAAVRVDSKWGYIDKNGKFVIEPQFRGAGPFSEGLAPAGNVDFMSVTRSDEAEPTTGFIDKQGKMVFSVPFDIATPFVNGISKVRVGIQLGYIDKTCKYIWQPSN